MSLQHAQAYSKGGILVDYGREIEHEIATLQTLVEERHDLPCLSAYNPRWLAIKLLEDDAHVVRRVTDLGGCEPVLAAARQGITHLEAVAGEESDTIIADRRYGYIHGLVREAVKRPAADRRTISDQIDGVLAHPVWGIPFFLAAMWIVFQMTANVSGFYLDWIDGVIGGPITRWVVYLLGALNLGGTWVESLVVEGVIAGVGGVMVFIPVLFFMYFFTALLEDSGYMARAAFLTDRFMHHIGLHGKSFIPMLLGFGCSVPGIYATRTLEGRDDRIMTGLLVPFMSCSARLPVYVIIGAAFFGARAGTLVFAMYILGIVMAILIGLLFKNTLFRQKEQAAFVMELPPYRAPALKGVLIHAWEHTWSFIKKAWTVILAVSVVIWLLLAVPVNAPAGARFAEVDAGHSALAAVGEIIAPVFAPAGSGRWETASALVTGVIAKEVVVSTLSQVYLGGEEAGEEPEPTTFLQDLGEIGLTFLQATWDTIRGTISIIPGVNLFGKDEGDEIDPQLVSAMQGAFTPLAAVAFCVFVLLYTPCMVTVMAMWHEYGARWALFGAGYTLALAWVVSTLVYQGGRLLGLG